MQIPGQDLSDASYSCILGRNGRIGTKVVRQRHRLWRMLELMPFESQGLYRMRGMDCAV